MLKRNGRGLVSVLEPCLLKVLEIPLHHAATELPDMQ